MDGNGRWANSRFRPRVWGHVRGSSRVADIVEAADDMGIKALTLYAFSTENWSRPENEVLTLFKLLKKFLLREKARLIKNRVQFKVIGDTSRLPLDVKDLIKDLEQSTQGFDGLMLSFAFSYGGRLEIISAVNKIVQESKGRYVTEEAFSKYLYRPECGDVDLLIRTGGDQRISNFLLWQMAYAELYFSDSKWPDFRVSEFKEIISQCRTRERRFGSLDNKSNSTDGISTHIQEY